MAKATQEKKPKRENEELLKTIRDRFGAASQAEDTNRRNYITDVMFSCAEDQWTEEAKRLRGPNRPALTFNRLNAVVKQIIGDYRQNKLSVKVLPADGEASEEIADILAGLIRNIETQSNADMAYTNALECSARGGFGYFRILPEYTGDDVFEQDLAIKPIHNPLTVYFDPRARLITRADAEWCFITETIPLEQFKREYPKASTTGFDDKSDDSLREWCEGESIRIAEYFEKARYTARLGAFSNGMVTEIKDDAEIAALAQLGITLVQEREAIRTKIIWRKVSGVEVLEEREYMTRYIPVIPVIGEEINVEGKVLTRSAIFYGKDAQRMYNYWKTTATEAVALTPKAKWIGTPKQFEGFEDQWANANTTAQQYLPYNADTEAGGPPQQVPPATPPVAEISLAMNASDDIKATTGIYDASLGQQSNETSGKAIVARQQQGATSTFIFIDNLKEAIQHCGRVLMDWIPQVYDSERVIRTLDLEGNPKTETVNQRNYDVLSGIVTVVNSITVGKYDVVVEAGPSFANQKLEMIAALERVLPALPIVGQAAPDLIVKALPFQGADQIAERVKRALPPQITEDPDSPEAQAKIQQAQEVQAQQQQQVMQVEQGKIDAENAKSQATVAKAEAEIIKARAGVVQQGMEGRQEQQEAAPRPSAPQQPGVTVQFNAEDALGRIGATMEEFVVHQAESTNQTMQAIQQVLQVTAQSTQMIAASLQAQQQNTAVQAEALQAVARESAESGEAVAEAVNTLAAVMAAPRVAVRDQAGNILASRVEFNPTGPMATGG